MVTPDRVRGRLMSSAAPWSPADRRLAAMKALASEGVLDAEYPVPCRVIGAAENAGELSLAENVVRVAMHPADQVVAFTKMADAGVSVTTIAARFGVAERLVEQRLRLGGVAPELLDAYRAQEMDLDNPESLHGYDRPRPPEDGLGGGEGTGLPPERLAGEAHADRRERARSLGRCALRG